MVSDAARQLAARRTRTEKVCPVCGRTFSGLTWQQYDTPQCQKRADYQRHAEQRRAAKREQYHGKAAHQPKETNDGEQ